MPQIRLHQLILLGCLTIAATPLAAQPATTMPAVAAPATTSTATTDTAITAVSPNAYMEAVAAAIKTDDHAEHFEGEPVFHRDLDTTIPADLAAADGISTTAENFGFVPTLATARGPVGSQPRGSLSGKIIYSSAGHGWTFETSTSVWYTQRPLTHGVVEDFGNLDQLAIFADACHRAGATFVPFRPVGHQPEERIIDNSSRTGIGFHGPWHDSTSQIYHGQPGDTVPYRFAFISTTETAVARYRPFIRKPGMYPVYTWVRDGGDRTQQLYRIVHGGNITEVRVDHSRVGKGWVWLGQYYFPRGDTGYVEISNLAPPGADPNLGRIVVADAIRFGNGLGDVNLDGGISSYPREEEASKYWAMRSIPASADVIIDTPARGEQGSNVGIPPRASAYMNRESAGNFFDRIYIGFHSNAIDPAQFKWGRGATGLFCNTPSLRTTRQVELAELVATVINNDFQTSGGKPLPVAYEPFQKLTYSHIDFGEIRGDYNGNEMAATIVEVAFHDNPLDAILLRDLTARRMYARSMVKAALQFFAQYHPQAAAQPKVLMPEAPSIQAVIAETSSALRVHFLPPAADPAGGAPPDSYMVYLSRDGWSFDGGRATTSTSLLVTELEPGVPWFARVAAVNAGGISEPSHTFCAMAATTQPLQARIIPAFTSNRDDVGVTQSVPLNLHGPFEPGGDFARVIPDLINPGNHTVRPAVELASRGISFESCTAEWLAQDGANAAPVPLLFVDYGRQSASDGHFTEPMQRAIQTQAATTGSVAVVGRNLALGLPASGSGAADFARTVLGFTPDGVTTRAQTLMPNENAGTTLTVGISDGTVGRFFRAVSYDHLKPASAAQVFLDYDDGGPAAVSTKLQGGGSAVSVPVAFDDLTRDFEFRRLMNMILQKTGISPATNAPADEPAES